MSITKKVLSKDGSKIIYTKTGTGPALIQVLGALNKRGRGEKLADLLNQHFTVISYDRRGRGDSEDSSSYSVENEVNDIEAIIDAIGGNAFLYGQSSGAILTLLAAHQLGKKVSGIVLYEVPYNDDSDALKLPMWKGLTAMAPTLRYDTIELMESFPNITTQEISVPTLVMYGEASPSFMAETAKKLSNQIPHATLTSLANQTHDVKPAALAPILIQYWK